MDQRELKTVYNRYSKPLFRFIYRFTANSEATEEILHDVFIEFLSGKFQAGQPHEEAQLKSWLYTLAKNKSLNFLKKAANQSPHDSITDSRESQEFNPELQMIEEESSRQFVLAESALPLDLKQTWSLRKQGLDYQEIASVLSIPVGTVKSRFHRLVKYLKKELKL